jgi:predicted dehydrogenase
LGGGALLELSHEIDAMYWLFGMPDRVWCSGGRLSSLEIDVEDVVELCLEYDNPRRLVTIHLDFVRRTPQRVLSVSGTLGTMTWRASEERLVIDVVEPDRRRENVNVSMPDRNAMYREELSRFLACAEQGEPCPINLESGIAVLAIVDAARRSMVSGCAEAPAQTELRK